MKEPLPPKSKPASLRKDAPAARPTNRVEQQLKVRYYCAMRRQRVHPLTVEVHPARGAAASGPSLPVVLRPVVPGAVVTPAEQALDAGQAGAKATFQVASAARGRLPEPRVEVYQLGRLADQVRLRMKATSQRRTWLLALLTLLVPCLLLLATHERYYKLRGKGRDIGQTDTPDLARDPGQVLEYRLVTFVDDLVPDIPGARDFVIDPVIRPVAKGLGMAYTWACNLAPDHLPFWVGTGLLALTIISWFAGRRQRTTRWKTVQLSAAVPLAEAAETLPLTAPEPAPITVRPVD
jgi:hypothetical protein